MPRTLRVIPSRIDAPLNMDKWVERICTPRHSKLFIILTDIHSADYKGYPQNYSQQSYTRLDKQSSACYSPTLPVSHCPVAWRVPLDSPLPAAVISYYGNNRKFCERLEMVNRVDVIGPGGRWWGGWGGVSCGGYLQ